jgi:hypothetical protein
MLTLVAERLADRGEWRVQAPLMRTPAICGAGPGADRRHPVGGHCTADFGHTNKGKGMS